MTNPTKNGKDPQDVSLASNELPEGVRRLLWNVDLSTMNQIPLFVVCAQVMERGGVQEMRWLLRLVGTETLQQIFAEISKKLSVRNCAFWACVLDCPRPSSQGLPWKGNSHALAR